MVCARVAAEQDPEDIAAADASYDQGIYGAAFAAADYNNMTAAASPILVFDAAEEENCEEPGWSDPELDAMAAELAASPQQQQQQTSAAVGFDSVLSEDEPGWDDPELDALAAEWAAQQNQRQQECGSGAAEGKCV